MQSSSLEVELNEYELWKAKSAKRAERRNSSKTPERLDLSQLEELGRKSSISSDTLREEPSKRSRAKTLGPAANSSIDLSLLLEPPLNRTSMLKAPLPNQVVQPKPVRVTSPASQQPVAALRNESRPLSPVRKVKSVDEDNTGSGVRQGGDYDSLLHQMQQSQKGKDKVLHR